MNLLPDENIILESDTKEIVLTSHRIWQKVDTFSSTEVKSIMLENISSCHSYRKSSFIVMLLGIFIGFVGTAGILLGGTTEKLLSIVFMVFIGLLYMWSKKHEIEIASPSARIIMNVDKMPQKAVEHFIDKVESAKHKRLLMLTK